MRKIFTFAVAVLFSASMLADVAVLSWQLGENGAYAEPANSITGAAGSAAEGWTIAITGNESKNWSAGNGKIFMDPDSVMTLKNSNGAQNTVTLPEGLYASQVEFYVVTNHDTDKGMLAEFDGEACTDSVYSLKDYENPTYIVKSLETPKNEFTFTFKVKQVCFIAVVTYSDQAPEAPKPFGLLSYNLGVDGADLGDAGKVHAITGATGSLAEGWTIAMEESNWSGGGKMTYKGTEFKTLKNSNGKLIYVTLPEGLYATDVEFRAVTNDDAAVGSLKEFDGESVKDTVFSLKDYANPTIIARELPTPKNEFTFLFGGKQVCFLAIVHYTDEAPEDPEPHEGIDNTPIAPKAVKRIENGQLFIKYKGQMYDVQGRRIN